MVIMEISTQSTDESLWRYKTVKNIKYDRDTLLEILESYARRIEREQKTGYKYSSAVLSDLEASINFVLDHAQKEQ